VGGLTEPLCSDLVVRFSVEALGVEHRKVVQGLAISSFAGREVKATRGVEIFFYAHALLIKSTETKLGGRQTLLGSTLEPGRRLGHALGHTATIGESDRHLELSGRITFARGGAQRSSDCRRDRFWRDCRRRRHRGRRGFRDRREVSEAAPAL